MKNVNLESKVQALFDNSSGKKQFENHMPDKVGKFLSDASKDKIDANILQEDISFARSISKAMQY